MKSKFLKEAKVSLSNMYLISIVQYKCPICIKKVSIIFFRITQYNFGATRIKVINTGSDRRLNWFEQKPVI